MSQIYGDRRVLSCRQALARAFTGTAPRRGAADDEEHDVYAIVLLSASSGPRRDRKAHDVTPLTGPSYLLKAGCAEGFDKAHESIAQGLRIDRVGFHDGRAIARGVIDGCQE